METEKNAPIKVLVAEDTDSNYLLVYTLLKKEYDVKRACNGLEAIEMYESYHPDIILMDMKMPEMDGFAATKQIRERDKEIPIIAVTAFAFDQDRQKAIQAGCNDYMSKPISRDILKEMIRKWSSK
mgnify:FL=1